MKEEALPSAIKVPGCMSPHQVANLRKAVERAEQDPSLLSDLEGCGPAAKLEAAFATVCGTKYALAVSSGTAAIHAALLAAGLGPGDEVIVTPYSWPQSVAPVLFTGATPVFADIDPETLNIDPESVRERISDRTKAIVPVHLFGNPCDMSALQEIAANAGVLLISDGAHALGASLDGLPAGAWGDVTCFSLGRGKLVSGGEGGVLTTNSKQLFEKALLLTQHPERARRVGWNPGFVEGLGLNFRIHPLAALLAYCDIDFIEMKLRNRRMVLELFNKGMGETESLGTPLILDGASPAAYGIPLIFRKKEGRWELAAQAQKRGIPLRVGPVRVPLHLQVSLGPGPRPLFHPSHLKGACPIAEEQCEKKELWALSAMDMDSMDMKDACRMGRMINDATASMESNEEKKAGSAKKR